QNAAWKSTVEPLGDNAYRIVLEASIPQPYHMYDMGPYEGGPNATAIVFTPGNGVTLESGVQQLSTPHRYYDTTFGMEIGTFSGKARFAQRVKLSVPESSVKARIEWMLCDDTSCMPPDDTEMTIAISAGTTPADTA
ncbi:protein-disulfide reductase DsbD domain-containing protein, partial [Alistipes timonensis]|uniref:protein-disulfide reductase DsbD domain-containing protein n=1 Tax=Alistipes timonensis TaxID=1465754 RepID=UPI000289204C